MKKKFISPEIHWSRLTPADVIASSALAQKNIKLTEWDDETNLRFQVWRGRQK